MSDQSVSDIVKLPLLIVCVVILNRASYSNLQNNQTVVTTSNNSQSQVIKKDCGIFQNRTVCLQDILKDKIGNQEKVADQHYEVQIPDNQEKSLD